MAPKSRMHKIGTMAADRERIATAFEEMARIIRAGREGWGMRAVGKAIPIFNKIPPTSKVLPELLEALIAHSGSNAPLLRVMLPLDRRAVKAEKVPSSAPKDPHRG